jgi:hypothetical protein
MKLQTIKISGFVGVDALDIDLGGRATLLLAGGNGQGKSSVMDAVKLAITGDLSRISLKKDASALVRSGHQTGAAVSVVDVDGDTYSATISKAGTLKTSAKGDDPYLRLVCDSSRLAAMDPKQRRAFLADLSGVTATPDDVAQRLLQRGCDAGRVERIKPLLRSGFEPAAQQAGAYASEARIGWKTITGEAYGSEKAKTWRAAVPAIDADGLAAAHTEVQHADVAIAKWQQEVGALAAWEKHRADLRAKLPALQEHAKRRQRIVDKLAADEAALADVREQLQKARAAAGAGPRVGLVHDLAAGLHVMLSAVERAGDEGLFDDAGDPVRARSALSRYETEHGKVGATAGDPTAAARLPELLRAETVASSAVANDSRDLTACDTAKAHVEAIEAELAETFDAAALADARAQVEALLSARREAQKRLDALTDAKRLADSAKDKTASAAAKAIDAAAWDQIAGALEPSGIPSEMLAASLKPINDRLTSSAQDTDWPLVQITGDIDITIAGRAYRLASASEQWRADAMLAEAVSHLSGAGLLLLDAADILEPSERPALIEWLHFLADAGELHTAIVGMTLKQPPTGMPSSVLPVWIANGRTAGQQSAQVAQKEAVAA